MPVLFKWLHRLLYSLGWEAKFYSPLCHVVLSCKQWEITLFIIRDVCKSKVWTFLAYSCPVTTLCLYSITDWMMNKARATWEQQAFYLSVRMSFLDFEWVTSKRLHTSENNLQLLNTFCFLLRAKTTVIKVSLSFGI